MSEIEATVDKNTTREVEITGIIVPHEWGPCNIINSIMVCAPGERDYLIVQNEMGKELLEYIHHMNRAKAWLKGILTQTDNGEKMIFVEQYELLKKW